MFSKMSGVALSTALALVVCAEQASAIAPFKKVFFDVYVKPDSTDPAEKAFAEAAEAKATGECWVCHAKWKGADKHVRNNYGKALSALLDKKNFSSERREQEPEKCDQEIRDALEKTNKLKSDPKDPNSPTFGDLIKSGKLPGNGIPDPDDLAKAKAKAAAEDDE
jgi:hypothetical protein